jgi:hypothetical protein
MNLAMLLLLSPLAGATTYDVRFCAYVEIDYIDLPRGDRWTDDSDRPARGFRMDVWNDSTNEYVWPSSGTGYAIDDDPLAGCTPLLELDDAHVYDVTVYSQAEVDGNYAYAYDDPSTKNLAVELVENDFQPTADATEDIGPIDGASEDRWNHLALAAFALYMHDGELTGKHFELYEDDCCFADSETKVHVAGLNRKFMVAHELGHLVSAKRDDDGSGLNQSYAADEDGCDGGGGSHGQLTKEYQSASAVEGIADFYAAMTWNIVSESADCEYQRQYGLDWNLDGTPDVNAITGHDCVGDPFSGSPDPVGSKDWLEDLVDADDDDEDEVQCEGTLDNRSTQYDWLRYYWSMVTLQDVPITDLWEIWDDADPHDWNSTDSGSSSDDPHIRIDTSAHANGYETEHDNEKDHFHWPDH